MSDHNMDEVDQTTFKGTGHGFEPNPVIITGSEPSTSAAGMDTGTSVSSPGVRGAESHGKPCKKADGERPGESIVPTLVEEAAKAGKAKEPVLSKGARKQMGGFSPKKQSESVADAGEKRTPVPGGAGDKMAKGKAPAVWDPDLDIVTLTDSSDTPNTGPSPAPSWHDEVLGDWKAANEAKWMSRLKESVASIQKPKSSSTHRTASETGSAQTSRHGARGISQKGRATAETDLERGALRFPVSTQKWAAKVQRHGESSAHAGTMSKSQYTSPAGRVKRLWKSASSTQKLRKVADTSSSESESEEERKSAASFKSKLRVKIRSPKTKRVRRESPPQLSGPMTGPVLGQLAESMGADALPSPAFCPTSSHTDAGKSASVRRREPTVSFDGDSEMEGVHLPPLRIIGGGRSMDPVEAAAADEEEEDDEEEQSANEEGNDDGADADNDSAFTVSSGEDFYAPRGREPNQWQTAHQHRYQNFYKDQIEDRLKDARLMKEAQQAAVGEHFYEPGPSGSVDIDAILEAQQQYRQGEDLEAALVVQERNRPDGDSPDEGAPPPSAADLEEDMEEDPANLLEMEKIHLDPRWRPGEDEDSATGLRLTTDDETRGLDTDPESSEPSDVDLGFPAEGILYLRPEVWNIIPYTWRLAMFVEAKKYKTAGDERSYLHPSRVGGLYLLPVTHGFGNKLGYALIVFFVKTQKDVKRAVTIIRASRWGILSCYTETFRIPEAEAKQAYKAQQRDSLPKIAESVKGFVSHKMLIDSDSRVPEKDAPEFIRVFCIRLVEGVVLAFEAEVLAEGLPAALKEIIHDPHQIKIFWDVAKEKESWDNFFLGWGMEEPFPDKNVHCMVTMLLMRFPYESIVKWEVIERYFETLYLEWKEKNPHRYKGSRLFCPIGQTSDAHRRVTVDAEHLAKLAGRLGEETCFVDILMCMSLRLLTERMAPNDPEHYMWLLTLGFQLFPGRPIPALAEDKHLVDTHIIMDNELRDAVDEYSRQDRPHLEALGNVYSYRKGYIDRETVVPGEPLVSVIAPECWAKEEIERTEAVISRVCDDAKMETQKASWAEHQSVQKWVPCKARVLKLPSQMRQEAWEAERNGRERMMKVIHGLHSEAFPSDHQIPTENELKKATGENAEDDKVKLRQQMVAHDSARLSGAMAFLGTTEGLKKGTERVKWKDRSRRHAARLAARQKIYASENREMYLKGKYKKERSLYDDEGLRKCRGTYEVGFVDDDLGAILDADQIAWEHERRNAPHEQAIQYMREELAEHRKRHAAASAAMENTSNSSTGRQSARLSAKAVRRDVVVPEADGARGSTEPKKATRPVSAPSAETAAGVEMPARPSSSGQHMGGANVTTPKQGVETGDISPNSVSISAPPPKDHEKGAIPKEPVQHLGYDSDQVALVTEKYKPLHPLPVDPKFTLRKLFPGMDANAVVATVSTPTSGEEDATMDTTAMQPGETTVVTSPSGPRVSATRDMDIDAAGAGKQQDGDKKPSASDSQPEQVPKAEEAGPSHTRLDDAQAQATPASDDVQQKLAVASPVVAPATVSSTVAPATVSSAVAPVTASSVVAPATVSPVVTSVTVSSVTTSGFILSTGVDMLSPVATAANDPVGSGQLPLVSANPAVAPVLTSQADPALSSGLSSMAGGNASTLSRLVGPGLLPSGAYPARSTTSPYSVFHFPQMAQPGVMGGAGLQGTAFSGNTSLPPGFVSSQPGHRLNPPMDWTALGAGTIGGVATTPGQAMDGVEEELAGLVERMRKHVNSVVAGYRALLTDQHGSLQIAMENISEEETRVLLKRRRDLANDEMVRLKTSHDTRMAELTTELSTLRVRVREPRQSGDSTESLPRGASSSYQRVNVGPGLGQLPTRYAGVVTTEWVGTPGSGARVQTSGGATAEGPMMSALAQLSQPVSDGVYRFGSGTLTTADKELLTSLYTSTGGIPTPSMSVMETQPPAAPSTVVTSTMSPKVSMGKPESGAGALVTTTQAVTGPKLTPPEKDATSQYPYEAITPTKSDAVGTGTPTLTVTSSAVDSDKGVIKLKGGHRLSSHPKDGATSAAKGAPRKEPSGTGSTFRSASLGDHQPSPPKRRRRHDDAGNGGGTGPEENLAPGEFIALPADNSSLGNSDSSGSESRKGSKKRKKDGRKHSRHGKKDRKDRKKDRSPSPHGRHRHRRSDDRDEGGDRKRSRTGRSPDRRSSGHQSRQSDSNRGRARSRHSPIKFPGASGDTAQAVAATASQAGSSQRAASSSANRTVIKKSAERSPSDVAGLINQGSLPADYRIPRHGSSAKSEPDLVVDPPPLKFSEGAPLWNPTSMVGVGDQSYKIERAFPPRADETDLSEDQIIDKYCEWFKWHVTDCKLQQDPNPYCIVDDADHMIGGTYVPGATEVKLEQPDTYLIPETAEETGERVRLAVGDVFTRVGKETHRKVRLPLVLAGLSNRRRVLTGLRLRSLEMWFTYARRTTTLVDMDEDVDLDIREQAKLFVDALCDETQKKRVVTPEFMAGKLVKGECLLRDVLVDVSLGLSPERIDQDMEHLIQKYVTDAKRRLSLRLQRGTAGMRYIHGFIRLPLHEYRHPDQGQAKRVKGQKRRANWGEETTALRRSSYQPGVIQRIIAFLMDSVDRIMPERDLEADVRPSIVAAAQALQMAKWLDDFFRAYARPIRQLVEARQDPDGEAAECKRLTQRVIDEQANPKHDAKYRASARHNFNATSAVVDEIDIEARRALGQGFGGQGSGRHGGQGSGRHGGQGSGRRGGAAGPSHMVPRGGGHSDRGHAFRGGSRRNRANRWWMADGARGRGGRGAR